MILIPAACMLVFAGALYATPGELDLHDATGDAVFRRTDPGNDGPLHPMASPLDLIEIHLASWAPNNPGSDPYSGSVVPNGTGDFLRLQLFLAGVVNPPGPLGLGGFPYDPFRFGVTPIYGFVELDLDKDENTGGELDASALHRPLANVARFASVPEGVVGTRIARCASDLDSNFSTTPQYERTGQDFSLNLCGCFDVTTVETFGDIDGSFDAGDTWIVQGRFFQRAGGFTEASGMFGGSFFGSYDPMVNLRFEHDCQSDETTVTLVYPLTMAGAAALANEPEQPIDLDVSNHTSVIEALDDIIIGAGGPLFGPTAVLTSEWNGDDPADFLKPIDWLVTAIIGIPYSTPQAELYVWTDVAGDLNIGDFDSSQIVTHADRQELAQQLASLDGGPTDADAITNGIFQIANPGYDFSLFDIDGDMNIDAGDSLAMNLKCDADANSDGFVNVDDLSYVLFRLGANGSPGLIDGDANTDGITDVNDISFVLFRLGSLCQ